MSHKIIDWKLALEFARGDEKAALKMVELLIQYIHDEYEPTLKKTFKSKGFKALSTIAHKIAGSSRYCGAMHLSDIASKLEDAVLDNSTELIDKYYKDLLGEMQKIPQVYQNIKAKL